MTSKELRRQQRERENSDNRLHVDVFTLGDIVKVIDRSVIKHGFEIGTVGVIEQIDQDGHCRVAVPMCMWWQWVAACDLEIWEE